jgi:Kef-type K+ transport system membrane component KefB
MVVLMLCAWFIDAMGIYAVFGAFILGGVMPRGEFADQIVERTESLIILNIGLEQGIITPVLFTIMVIMAIVTTLMASPLVTLLLQGTSYEKSPA